MTHEMGQECGMVNQQMQTHTHTQRDEIWIQQKREATIMQYLWVARQKVCCALWPAPVNHQIKNSKAIANTHTQPHTHHCTQKGQGHRGSKVISIPRATTVATPSWYKVPLPSLSHTHTHTRVRPRLKVCASMKYVCKLCSICIYVVST